MPDVLMPSRVSKVSPLLLRLRRRRQMMVVATMMTTATTPTTEPTMTGTLDGVETGGAPVAVGAMLVDVLWAVEESGGGGGL